MIAPARCTGREVGASLLIEQCVRGFGVIASVFAKNMPQMRLSEDENVINALGADGSDQPLYRPILPGRARRYRPIANPVPIAN